MGIENERERRKNQSLKGCPKKNINKPKNDINKNEN